MFAWGITPISLCSVEAPPSLALMGNGFLFIMFSTSQALRCPCTAYVLIWLSRGVVSFVPSPQDSLFTSPPLSSRWTRRWTAICHTSLLVPALLLGLSTTLSLAGVQPTIHQSGRCLPRPLPHLRPDQCSSRMIARWQALTCRPLSSPLSTLTRSLSRPLILRFSPCPPTTSVDSFIILVLPFRQSDPVTPPMLPTLRLIGLLKNSIKLWAVASSATLSIFFR
jgi:hypothetical protein